MANFLREFRYVLAKGDDLPSLPSVVFELYSVLNNDMSSGASIAEIIERDPAMATKLLRLANSAAFNCGSPIGDVAGAIQLLGIRQVRAMCVALSVTNMFSSRDGGLVGTAFWEHSAGVANTARSLARCLQYTHVSAGELYVAGLLHDVGLLVMDQRFSEELRGAYEVAKSCDSPLWKGENITLATDHGEIGGLLLDRWELPSSIVSMVTAHHNPKLAPAKYRDPCWLIYTAEILHGGLGTEFEIECHSREQAQEFLDLIRKSGFDIEELTEGLEAQPSIVADTIAA